MQGRLGPHQHRPREGRRSQDPAGQREQSLSSEAGPPQEAARQTSVQWSEGVTSSDWARLFGYMSVSFLPAEHSAGRSPGDNTQNQAQFQVIGPVTAGPPGGS